MKKLLALCMGLVPCAALAATNKISMVTYFPVSYVAYSQVDAKQMDIGLTSTCNMNLGCDSVAEPLNAAKVNLQSGTLALEGGVGIEGGTLSLGSGPGLGKISFSNVRFDRANMQSLNANNMTVENLKLFGKDFPKCPGEKMHWKKLLLKGAGDKEELYLVCGDTPTGCQTLPPPPTETEIEYCYDGTTPKTPVLNEATCSWEWDGSVCANIKVACCKIVKQSAEFYWMGSGNQGGCASSDKKIIETASSIKFYDNEAYEEWSRAMVGVCPTKVEEGLILDGTKRTWSCYEELHWQNNDSSNYCVLKATADRYVCKDIIGSAGEVQKCSQDDIHYLQLN